MLQKIVRSTIIDAPIERVWAVLRDFNSHDQWHDVVEASRIEANESSAQVGCVRSFTLKDGNRIREQLLTLDDREHKSTYCIVEATVPLQRYVATVTLKPAGVAAEWLTSMCVPTDCSAGQSRCGLMALRQAHSSNPTMKPVAKTCGIS